jgi:hypothetical protein
MYARLLFAVVTGIMVLAVGCGDSTSVRRRTSGKYPPGMEPGGESGADNWQVRGRWTLPMTVKGAAGAFVGEDQLVMLSSAASNQSVSASVAANVRVTVDNSSFGNPANYEGLESFGALEITDLRDNALRVCGAGGNQKCTQAAVRLYTTGTPSDGLYSSTEDYGLPISTGGNSVGLGTASAAMIATYAIGPNKHVMHLNDFTNAASLSVPVAVDFTDAAASDYTTTLVLEYVTQ